MTSALEAFPRRDGVLYAEDVPLSVAAAIHGTPTYVYSRAAIEARFRAYDAAFGRQPHLVCFAVKANSNLAVLNLLARLGAGFDIVSGGELERVLAAGGEASKVVFSGVGKSRAEMARALEVGIRCFNVESLPELDRLNEVALVHGTRAPVSLRVNPDVDAKTHPYISTGLRENKFGIAIEDAETAYLRAAALPGLAVVGVACHIGSQLTELAPFIDALERVLVLVERLAVQGVRLHHLDLGGGLGIRYRDETPPTPAELIGALMDRLGQTDYELIVEPGRSIVGNAGVLLTRVELLKHGPYKDFAVVDAAMNDLMRPALYGSWMDIQPVVARKGEPREYDVVGPVCETGDFLGKGRSLVLVEGDVLAIMGAGAYGFTMSSNYNTRPRAAEVMVDGSVMHVVREREHLPDLWRGERLLP
ncbi:MAG: diaminopimelate decarboxylase [Halothiobacillaceae bacterium]